MPTLDFAWWPSIFFLLALIPMGLYAHKRKNYYSFLHSHLAENLAKIASSHSLVSNRPKPNWWLICLWTLMVMALMRPQFIGQPLQHRREGRNIMLALDISESMEAKDLNINGQIFDRLSVAKSVLADFIDRRKGDRVGLVVFGSESFLHAPLSFDHKTIKTFLFDAQIGFSGPKTAIGEAIGLSVKKLTDLEAKDKILVLLTDGQNNSGVLTPEQAAQIAKKHGIKIYIVGVGASQMQVDGFFGQVTVNPSKDLEDSEPLLKQIAKDTGGVYFRAKDTSTLEQVYAQIDALEPSEVDPLVINPKKELFFWPLSLLVLLLFSRFFQKFFAR